MSARIWTEPNTGGMSRRRFVQGLAAGAIIAAFSPWPSLRVNAATRARPNGAFGIPELSGSEFDLAIEPTVVNITGLPRIATLVNGLIPGPLLRWREGDTVTLRVRNGLHTSASIHWHGIRAPTQFDGVPGISFPGIVPGETFVYRFTVNQSGTYWYHSHSGFQEQTGLYGPLIVEPRTADPVKADRDYVIMLNDWTDEDPDEVYTHLKQYSDYYNYHQRTVGTFMDDIKHNGLAATLKDRFVWDRMRMNPRDISDVSGATYTYLINGQPPAANWCALFKPGERVRLRFINGSAMTYFDVRIPGLKMKVIQADGNYVEPVSVDEFRIAVAETYDVVVEPVDDAYTIFAQAMDRSGYARGTLASRAGLRAPVPPMDPIITRTMVDMGMPMKGGMNMDRGRRMEGMPGTSKETATKSGKTSATDMRMPMGNMPGMAGMSGTSMPQSPAKPGRTGMTAYPQPRDVHLERGVAVVNIAMAPTERLDKPGDGLNNNGRRVLTYADLVRRDSGPQNAPYVTRAPDAEVLLHLTGNMERYIFGFNGLTYEQSQPVRFPHGQRIRVTLINDTMMEHPIHLHGLWSELENHHGRLRPLKHTISVKPGEKLHYYVDADALGRWAYHCHLLYHMEAGMFTSAVVG